MTKLGYVFEGDPKIDMIDGGSRLVYYGGQPVMDRGLENAAIISLFTKPGWEGNRLLRGQHEAIGSLYEQVANEESITITTLDRVASAARTALAWMVSARIASRIETEATNPTGRQIDVSIEIYPVGDGDPIVLLLTRNGPNWINQKLDPAHERV